MIAWGSTHAGMVRQQNQDDYHYAVDVKHDLAVLIICDGMGGANAGNVASTLAIQTAKDELRQSLKPHMNAKALKHALEMAVYRANRVVGDHAKSSPECYGMGTTLAAAIVSEGLAVIANVGDSRTYLINGDGISRITRDHSWVEDMVYRGDLTEEEAKSHPQKNLITRALGTEMDVSCDLYEVSVEKGDFLLLCSDGLSNMLDDQELLFEVIHGGDHQSCCQRLTKLANNRGGYDNITVLLLAM